MRKLSVAALFIFATFTALAGVVLARGVGVPVMFYPSVQNITGITVAAASGAACNGPPCTTVTTTSGTQGTATLAAIGSPSTPSGVTYALNSAGGEGGGVKCTATNGANNSSFTLSSGTLTVPSSLATGTYHVCYDATSSSNANSFYGQALTVIVNVSGSNTITGASIAYTSGAGGSCGSPNCTFVNGTGGTATLSATGSPSNPSSPTFALATSGSTGGTSCTTTNGADNGSFTLSSSTLTVSSSLASGGGHGTAGAYDICVNVAASGYTPSEFGAAFVITVSGTFPITVSSVGGPHLQTAYGAPYIILGDSPQAANTIPLCSAGNTYSACSSSGDTLPTNATFVAYARDRQAQGFNSLWVNILCEVYTACNNNGATQEGTYPFTAQLSGTGYPGGTNYSTDSCPENGSTSATPNDMDCWDLSSGINFSAGTATGANAAYWTHVDGYFKVAAQFGMQIFANPLPLDACANQAGAANTPSGGSVAFMLFNNDQLKVANVVGYADFLYNRYGNPSSANYAPNLIWWLGNDSDCLLPRAYPNSTLTGADNIVYAFAHELYTDEQAAPRPHLMTTELSFFSASLVDTANPWNTILSIDGDDSAVSPLYDIAQQAWALNSTTIPAMVVEAEYQGGDATGADDSTATGTLITGCGYNAVGGTNSGQGDPNACPYRARALFWQHTLAGGYAGYVDGNIYTWPFSQGWYNGSVNSPINVGSNTCTGTSGTGHSPCLDTTANANFKNAVAFLLNNTEWYKLKPDVTSTTTGTTPFGSGFRLGTEASSPFVTGCYTANTCATYYIGSNPTENTNLARGILQTKMPTSGVTSDGLQGLAYINGINTSCNYGVTTVSYTSCSPATGLSIEVNTTLITGSSGVTAYWIDPSGTMSGLPTPICSPNTTACTSGTHVVFTTPTSGHTDANAADWVLFLTSTNGPQVPVSITFNPTSPQNVLDTAAANTQISAITVNYSSGGTTCSGSCTLTLTANTTTNAVQVTGANLETKASGALTSADNCNYTSADCSPVVQACENSTCISATMNLIISSNTQTPTSTVIASDGCSGTACSVPNIDDASQFSASTTTGSPPTGTYIGTLSTTVTGTPPFNGSYGFAPGAGTGEGSCTGSYDQTHFRVTSPDQLQTNGAVAGTTYNLCITTTSGGVTIYQPLTIAVHNVVNASTATTGGLTCSGSGTTGSPWNYGCIQNAVTNASTGDTVFLPAGHWSLNTSDASGVTINKTINLLGAGSGNSFNVYGQPNNAFCATYGASGSNYDCLPNGTFTRVYTTGTNFANSTPGTGGYISFLSCTTGNDTVSNIFFDGSGATAGGDTYGTLNFTNCPTPTVNNIRVWAFQGGGNGSSYCTSGTPLPCLNPETQFFIYGSNNSVVQNSIFAEPSMVFSGAYSSSQIYQEQWHNYATVNNNVFYQQTYNGFYLDNVTLTNNSFYTDTDSIGSTTIVPAQSDEGCANSGGGCYNGSLTGNYHYYARNNLFYAPGNPFGVGGGVNDPTTNGIVNDQQWSGNWLIVNQAWLTTCAWRFQTGSCDPGEIGSIGMQVGQTGQSVDGMSFTNNSVIASGSGASANIDFRGSGCPCQSGDYVDNDVSSPCSGTGANVGTGAVCPLVSPNTVSTLNEMQCIYCSAQNNYLSSPSNQYLTNANSVNPSQSNNYCTGSSFTGCNTSGFTTPPTASFTLGTLSGTTVPFTSTSFTAQYGAVQWLASTSPTTPTSSGQSGGNSWSYVPPASLSSVPHGSTVYLWVMDNVDHIVAATPETVP